MPWTPEAGETFESFGQSGAITELDPPRVIAWSWGDERFRFELRPEGDGCLLDLHAQLRRSHARRPARGRVGCYFDRLATVLGGAELSEEAAHDLDRRAPRAARRRLRAGTPRSAGA